MARKFYEGVLDACRHRISFYFDIGYAKLTDELKVDLCGEAERRAREMIAEDYCEGELLHMNGAVEMRGWWKIT